MLRENNAEENFINSINLSKDMIAEYNSKIEDCTRELENLKNLENDTYKKLEDKKIRHIEKDGTITEKIIKAPKGPITIQTDLVAITFQNKESFATYMDQQKEYYSLKISHLNRNLEFSQKVVETQTRRLKECRKKTSEKNREK